MNITLGEHEGYAIIVEEHDDGYVGHVEGIAASVGGEGETSDEAFRATRAALRCYLKTFGLEPQRGA